MSKFHINKHGVPAPCRAKKGNCPLGGEGQHFDTQEEAQEYADKINEEVHDLLPGMNSNEQSQLFKRNYDFALSRTSSIEKEMLTQNTEDIGGYVKAIEDVSAMRIGDKSLANSVASKSLDLRERNDEIEKAASRDVDEELGISANKDSINLLNNNLVDAQNNNDKKHGVGETCPKCGKGTLVKRSGKYGDFVACDNFPECKSTSKFSESKEEKEIKGELKAKESQIRVDEMNKPRFILNKVKENDEHRDNKAKMEELSKLSKLASYVDKHTEDGSKTPVEEYYELRKGNDSKIREKIGENKTVFVDGELSPGSSVKVGNNLSVDKEGKINNLYIEKEDSGEVERVVGFNQGRFVLENDEKIGLKVTSNWNMSSSRSATHPQKHRVYEVAPSGEDYKQDNMIRVQSIDTSD